ncbi:MAG: M48 family metallopeptidase, partial [Bdellovibrionales bacterium]|nr:M48 family metallopeptidase [Bdellovibrionales bacterium]
MNISRISLILLLTLHCSCSLNRKIVVNSQDFSIQNSRGLFANYSADFSFESQEYLKDLLYKLWLSIPEPSTNNYHLLVLSSQDPLALSLGAGYLVISKELISELKTEGQLFFVIAHEIAHFELKHEKLDDSKYSEVELEADNYAMEMLIAAGYNPNDGIASIINLSKHPRVKHSEKYPLLETRISELRKIIN